MRANLRATVLKTTTYYVGTPFYGTTIRMLGLAGSGTYSEPSSHEGN